MNAHEALKSSMDLGEMVLKTYLSDLSDADLLRRPGTGCNHLAWQIGHLINSEKGLLEMVCPGKGVELPAGFAEQHGKEAAGRDDAAAFLKKDEYLALFDQQRAATKTALDGLSAADLDKAGPEHFAKICPTVGAVFSLIGSHVPMHAGQFVIVRRALGKPVLI